MARSTDSLALCLSAVCCAGVIETAPNWQLTFRTLQPPQQRRAVEVSLETWYSDALEQEGLGNGTESPGDQRSVSQRVGWPTCTRQVP